MSFGLDTSYSQVGKQLEQDTTPGKYILTFVLKTLNKGRLPSAVLYMCGHPCAAASSSLARTQSDPHSRSHCFAAAKRATILSRLITFNLRPTSIRFSLVTVTSY